MSTTFHERLAATEQQYDMLAVHAQTLHERLSVSSDPITVSFSPREAQEVMRALGQHLSQLGTLLSMAATVLGDDGDPFDYDEVRESFRIIDDAFSATGALVSAGETVPDEVPSWL